jgi:hypothetical protein
MRPVTLVQRRTPKALATLLIPLRSPARISSAVETLLSTLGMVHKLVLLRFGSVPRRISRTRPRKAVASIRSVLSNICLERCRRNAVTGQSGGCVRWSSRSRVIQIVSCVRNHPLDYLLTYFETKTLSKLCSTWQRPTSAMVEHWDSNLQPQYEGRTPILH